MHLSLSFCYFLVCVYKRINFLYTDNIYTFIIRCMTHNLNLKLKFCICVVYPIMIVYTLSVYTRFNLYKIMQQIKRAIVVLLFVLRGKHIAFLSYTESLNANLNNCVIFRHKRTNLTSFNFHNYIIQLNVYFLKDILVFSVIQTSGWLNIQPKLL